MRQGLQAGKLNQDPYLVQQGNVNRQGSPGREAEPKPYPVQQGRVSEARIQAGKLNQEPYPVQRQNDDTQGKRGQGIKPTGSCDPSSKAWANRGKTTVSFCQGQLFLLPEP